MARPRGFLGVLALFLLIALGGWYYQSPWAAWDRFLRALTPGDGVTLEQSVDFPAVRTHLRDDLMALASRNLRLAPQLDATTIDPLLDVVVSPAGLEQPVNSGIFTLERSGASWRLVRIWSDRLATSAESS